MAVLENELAGNAFESLFIDKAVIRRIVAEQNAKSGFVPDPTATALRGRTKMIAQGVKPEDCIGSADVVAMRDEH